MIRDQILTGDMRELIQNVPASSVGLLLSDPPYNIGFKGYDIHDDRMPCEDYVEMLCEFQRFPKVALISYPEEVMRYFIPAMGPPDHVGAWCYNANIPRRFRLICYWGVTPDYSRLRQPYKNPTDRRVRELMANGAEGSALYEWWDDIQLVKNVAAEKGGHPCPVPVRLMERIILLTTEPGELVLDPFTGEGTTAAAAKANGRNYLGFELSPAYAERARERLEATPTPLFAA